MKRGLGVIFFVIGLIIISNVLAYTSTITVKTGIPNQEIIFKACDQATGETLLGGDFRQKSNAEGQVVFDYDLDSVLIKMSFMAWNGNGYTDFLNGKQAIFIPNVILDEFVDINLNQAEPSWEAYSGVNETVEEVSIEISKLDTNETLNETVETDLVNAEQTEASITGAVVKGGRINPKIIYYSIVGIIVIGILFFTVFMINARLKSKSSPNFKVTPLSEVRYGSNSPQGDDERIAEAERKLEEAKRDLEQIKNRGARLKEAQERLKRDKEELRRLEEGSEENQEGFY